MPNKSFISDRVLSIPLSSIRRVEQYAREKGIKDIIKLNIGEPDFSTPEHIREAAKKALDEGFTHYTSINGIPELREAIAEKIKEERGVDINPETEVMVTAGGQAALFATIHALINPGDEVIMPDPYYPVYKIAVDFAGGKVKSIPQKEELNFEIDPNELEGAISERTKLIVLISPNNPTGGVYSKSTLEKIAEIAKENDLLVISDEVYEKFIYDDIKFYSIISVSDMKDRTIIINSFSKTYAMTGWRIGYIVANKEIIDAVKKVHHPINICANSISQKAALAALTGPQDCVKEMINEFNKRRKYIIRSLGSIKGIKCSIPRGAFYVFPNIRIFGMSSEDLVKFLIEKARVMTVPGSGFGRYGEGHIRIAYTNSLDKIMEGIERIKSALESLMQ